ncbi:hypothetical protein KOW79_009505 [Hemibagrus wyckioides]|uniref:Uncharacterized protein n=1 Tax=Hemibagrus wyckioides TaxID=337641 RepID=A0A9D3SNS3_9TELE|nr:hypothetical protein KOW79_009505 [Hemibagrus wyckioides]
MAEKSVQGFTPTLPSDPLWGDLSCLTAFCWKHQGMSGVFSSSALSERSDDDEVSRDVLRGSGTREKLRQSAKGFTPTLPSDPLWGDLSCLTAFCWGDQLETYKR